jgi:sugar porter (SP) family MFS transporter
VTPPRITPAGAGTATSGLIAALAGLLFGFDTAVIAGVTQDIAERFALGSVALGALVSAALWGTLVGAAGAGVPGDRFGARDSLRGLGLLFVVGAAGSSLATSAGMLATFRVLIGLAVGGASVLAPVYLAEIAPAERRGRVVGLFQLSVVAGILIAYLSNMAVSAIGFGELTWRVKLFVPVVPALAFLLLMGRAPQSVRWLVARGRVEEARAVAGRGEAIDLLLSRIEEERRPSDNRLSWRTHRRPIVLAILLAAFNQLSGINAILYYSNDIFASAGFDGLSSDLQSVVIGAVNFAFTLVGLALIDRIGRKPLLLWGAAGTAAALAATGVMLTFDVHTDLLVWALAGFIASFALSQGAVIWVYLSEIFPTPVRSRGQALGSGVHWAINAGIAAVFPLVAQQSEGLPFFFFAAFTAIQFVVVALVFPETKRRTLEELGRSSVAG